MFIVTEIGQGCLTEGGQETANRRVVLGAAELVLTEDITADTLDDTSLGVTLVLKLAQAEGEDTELLLDLGEDLAGSRALEAVGDVGAAVQGRALVEVLVLAGAEGDAHLDAPNLASLGDTIALGALGGSQDNLLGAFNLVVVKQPRGGAVDEVAVEGLADLLENRSHLGLGGSSLGGSLGLLLVGALGQEAGGDHEAEEHLVGVVGGVHQVGRAAGDLLLGTSDDGVADDGTKAIDLGAELDLDRLARLDLLVGLGLIRDERRVRGDVGSGGDGGGVRETCRWAPTLAFSWELYAV